MFECLTRPCLVAICIMQCLVLLVVPYEQVELVYTPETANSKETIWNKFSLSITNDKKYVNMSDTHYQKLIGQYKNQNKKPLMERVVNGFMKISLCVTMLVFLSSQVMAYIKDTSNRIASLYSQNATDELKALLTGNRGAQLRAPSNQTKSGMASSPMSLVFVIVVVCSSLLFTFKMVNSKEQNPIDYQKYSSKRSSKHSNKA